MSDSYPAPTDMEELFALLGNQTRMQILRVLWDEFDFEQYVTESRDGIRFAALRDRAGIDDPGNYNYHLGRLVGTVVEDREDGYVLTPLGYNLMQAIDSYASFSYETVEEWVVDDACPFCGGCLAAEYRREVLEVRCRDCGGLGSDGNFTSVELSSTGVQHLDEQALLDAAIVTMASKVRSSMQGICWNCKSAVDTVLEDCERHERDHAGICGNCNHRYRSTVDVTCPTCGTEGHGPVIEYAIVSPRVGAFFADADHGPGQIGSWRYRLDALGAATETVTDTDPVTVRAEFSFGGDSCRVRIESGPSGIAVTDSQR